MKVKILSNKTLFLFCNMFILNQSCLFSKDDILNP